MPDALIADSYAAINLSVSHAIEDIVDIFQRALGDGGLDKSPRKEVQSFSHVLAGTNERAANGLTLEHNIEDRCWELSRWKSVEDNRSSAARHAERLTEGLLMHRSN